MAIQQELLSITTDQSRRPCERITHLVGLNPSGMRWKMTLPQVIEKVERGEWTLYLDLASVRMDVFVATDPASVKYLKTAVDDKEPTLLLRLPEWQPD